MAASNKVTAFSRVMEGDFTHAPHRTEREPLNPIAIGSYLSRYSGALHDGTTNL